MDIHPRIAELIALLKNELGYTDQCIGAHWQDGWPSRRWYSFEGNEATILQVICANIYVRITLLPDGSFEFGRLTSEEFPMRPKTDFFKGRLRVESTSVEAIEAFIVECLAPQEKREAA